MTNSTNLRIGVEEGLRHLQRFLQEEKDSQGLGSQTGEPIPRTGSESISHLLLNLYQMAMGSPMGDFDEQLFPLLQEYLPFDAAWMGRATMTLAGPVMHNSKLWCLPDDFVSSWEAVKTDDPLVSLATERFGKPVVVSVLEAHNARSFWTTFGERYGIAQAMCTVVVDPALKTCTHLSLYRYRILPEFNTQEVELMEGIMPNLASAISMNRIHHIDQLRASTSKPRVARCICDRRGMLQYADAEFADLMLMEWPEWNRAILPGVLQGAPLQSAPTAYVGTQITLDIELIADLLVVQARPRSAIDALTPKELTVARLFGEGQTYKAVAKRLGISPATVRHHLRKAYTKLNIQNKGEIAWLLSNE